MATTQKGIYYPDDYTAVADVPEDMKKQAESVDTAIGNVEDTIEQDIQTQIDNIEEEQTTQNNEITALQTENTRLKATLPTTTGEGEDITLSNTAELEFIQPPLPRGNSEQVQIDNMLTLTEVSGGSNDIAPTLTNGIVNVKGRNNTDYTTKGFYQNGFVNFKNTQKWKDNTKYYISCKIEVVSNQKNLDTTYFSCFLYGEKVFEIRYNTTSQRYTGTITTATLTDSQKDKTFFEVRVDGTELNISEISIKTTQDYTFNGYGIQPSPEQEAPITNVTGDVEVLVQNKNLFDLNKILYGEIDSNGDLSLFATTRDFYKIDFKENTQYTISGYVKRTSGNVRMRCMYTDGTYSEFFNPNASDNFSFSSFTSLANKTIDKIVVYYGSAGYLYIKDGEMQIEQGTTATTYTPHQEQTFLFPLGTQRMYLGDYLADDGIHHVRGRYIFTGNETFGYFGTDSNGNGYATTFSMSTFIRTSTNMLCNMLKYDSNLLTDTIPYCLYFIVNNRGLTIKLDNTVTSASEIQNYIKQKYDNGNPFILEYPLATEEITPYTTEQQQAYNEIKQAISYEEQTNISGSSDEANPIFSIEAYQSTKLVLQEISNAVVALGGV